MARRVVVEEDDDVALVVGLAIPLPLPTKAKADPPLSTLARQMYLGIDFIRVEPDPNISVDWLLVAADAVGVG